VGAGPPNPNETVGKEGRREGECQASKRIAFILLIYILYN